MIALKFLADGAVGPFSGVRWPRPEKNAPGAWLKGVHGVAICRRGVHACRTRDLPWWIATELWRIELSGPITLGEHKVVATTGRLLARVETWTAQIEREYATACAWRARDHAVEMLSRRGHPDRAAEMRQCTDLQELLDVSRRLAGAMPDSRNSLTIAGDGALGALSNGIAASAYIAAHAAGRLDGPPGLAAERAWQARWLERRLDLTGVV